MYAWCANPQSSTLVRDHLTNRAAACTKALPHHMLITM